MLKKVLIGVFCLFLVTGLSVYLVYLSVLQGLPEIIKIEDYKPLLVSQVYDRNNVKIGEFYRERRVLVPYNDLPKSVVNAFLAAEDGQFFEHRLPVGVNWE